MGLSRDLVQTREFFTSRAAGWEDRHPDDDVLFNWAVNQLKLSPGDVAIDAGCGSGRALASMRAAVGPQGAVLGIDATPAMLCEASRLGRQAISVCAVGDVGALPVRENCVRRDPGCGAASPPARSRGHAARDGPGGSARRSARSLPPHRPPRSGRPSQGSWRPRPRHEHRPPPHRTAAGGGGLDPGALGRRR